MQLICIILLMFFIYSFAGWVLEIIYNYIDTKKIINRGFLIGPIVPIYGVGSLLIHFYLSRYDSDAFVLFVMTMFICGTLEYITSYLMEVIFKNRWWDYTHMKFQVNGRICLENCILFGIGGLVSVYLVNPYLVPFLYSIPLNIATIISTILTTILLVDICISFNIIIKLKNISDNIRTDSTEVLTKKVKEILINKTYPYRRLLQSFPNMRVFNKISKLKDKLKLTRKEIREEKKRTKESIFKRVFKRQK